MRNAPLGSGRRAVLAGCLILWGAAAPAPGGAAEPSAEEAGAAAPAADARDVDARDNVVMINGTTRTGRAVRGAGLIVGSGPSGRSYIVTARHVVVDEIGGPYEIAVLPPAAPDRPFPAELVKVDFAQEVDLAVIAAELPGAAPAGTMPIGRLAEPVEPGEGVKLIGQTEGVPWAESPLPEKVGITTPSRIVVQSDFGGPGLSGGAALDQSRRVIGIALSDDRSIITILPLSVIAEELRRAGIPFAIEDGRRIARLSTQAALSMLDAAKQERSGANLGQIEAISVLAGQGYDFTGSDLSGISFEGAALPGAGISEAKLWLTDLDGADLAGADLSGSGLRFASAAGASFAEADLSGIYAPLLSAPRADFRNADLRRAILVAADLREADFTGARLDGAAFAFADLRGAIFRGADLSHVHFVGASLEGAEFTGALFDESNMLAARLDPFLLTRKQRAGTCQVPVAGSDSMKIVQRWESSRFSSGYEYGDLVSEWLGNPALYLSLLRPCETPDTKLDGFYPSSPGGQHVSIERDLLTVAGRRDEVRRRFLEAVERVRTIPPGTVLYSAF